MEKAPVKNVQQHAEKLLKVKARAEMMAKWRAKSEKEMKQDGKSRMELLDQLEPGTSKGRQEDDPAYKAVQAFMKLQREYEAQACVVR